MRKHSWIVNGLLLVALGGLIAFISVAKTVIVAFHGNVNSKIYHNSGCRYFDRKSCTENFATQAEAREAGYRPCKVCIS